MKNWTIKEAVNVINAGTDEAAIRELAKHFPMFFMAVAKNDLLSLANAMGDKFTVRKLDFSSAASEDDDDADDEVTDTDDAGDAEESPADPDLSTMSTKQLMKLCDDRGIKVPHYGKNKQFYLDALSGASAKKAAPAEEEEEDEAEETTEKVADPYAGKTAPELYKECKKRGIKAETKKPAKYYVELLNEYDAANAKATEEEDTDDWNDDDAEEEAPKAKSNKGNKKSGKATAEKQSSKGGKKKAAKAEPEEEAEDEDDSWDI